MVVARTAGSASGRAALLSVLDEILSIAKDLRNWLAHLTIRFLQPAANIDAYAELNLAQNVLYLLIVVICHSLKVSQ